MSTMQEALSPLSSTEQPPLTAEYVFYGQPLQISVK